MPIDVERALRGLDGNTELLKDLASMFVEDAPILLASFHSAIANDHPVQAQAVVHGLKGLIATFYAKSSVTIAQRLEDATAEGELSRIDKDDVKQLELSVGSIITEFVARGWANRQLP